MTRTLCIAAALAAMTLSAAAQPAGPPISDRARSVLPPERPYACRLLDEAERKCGFDPKCDKRELDRLIKECLRDGGRP